MFLLILICSSNQVELKEFVKVGHDIYKVPRPSDPEDEAGKVVRRIREVENCLLIYEIKVVLHSCHYGQ